MWSYKQLSRKIMQSKHTIFSSIRAIQDKRRSFLCVSRCVWLNLVRDGEWRSFNWIAMELNPSRGSPISNRPKHFAPFPPSLSAQPQVFPNLDCDFLPSGRVAFHIRWLGRANRRFSCTFWTSLAILELVKTSAEPRGDSERNI
jgi:hypothetical protein